MTAVFSIPYVLARILILVRDDIVNLLGHYKNVFAFDPSKMLGIARDVIQHRLNVDPNHKPIIQKKRHLGTKRSTAAATEVKKLLEARFLREC